MMSQGQPYRMNDEQNLEITSGATGSNLPYGKLELIHYGTGDLNKIIWTCGQSAGGAVNLVQPMVGQIGDNTSATLGFQSYGMQPIYLRSSSLYAQFRNFSICNVTIDVYHCKARHDMPVGLSNSAQLVGSVPNTMFGLTAAANFGKYTSYSMVTGSFPTGNVQRDLGWPGVSFRSFPMFHYYWKIYKHSHLYLAAGDTANIFDKHEVNRFWNPQLVNWFGLSSGSDSGAAALPTTFAGLTHGLFIIIRSMPEHQNNVTTTTTTSIQSYPLWKVGLIAKASYQWYTFTDRRERVMEVNAVPVQTNRNSLYQRPAVFEQGGDALYASPQMLIP